jgi:LmbE family N-acetylglucosaminyl deacetylase
MKPDALSLLVFGAHPDDIEFGCGGVIARETQTGCSAHFVVCSRGESATNGTPAQRTKEAKQGARLLGATIEFIDLGGDAHFEANVAFAIKLASIIRRVHPQIVLAPTPVENQHPDHSVLGRLARDAARLARYGGMKELAGQPAHAIEHLLFYAVTVEAEPTDRPPVFFDVSAPAVMESWRQAMAAHASQAKTRNYVEFQLERAKLNGLRCEVDFALPLFLNDPLVVTSLAQLGRSARRF